MTSAAEALLLTLTRRPTKTTPETGDAARELCAAGLAEQRQGKTGATLALTDAGVERKDAIKKAQTAAKKKAAAPTKKPASPRTSAASTADLEALEARLTQRIHELEDRFAARIEALLGARLCLEPVHPAPLGQDSAVLASVSASVFASAPASVSASAPASVSASAPASVSASAPASVSASAPASVSASAPAPVPASVSAPAPVPASAPASAPVSAPAPVPAPVSAPASVSTPPGPSSPSSAEVAVRVIQVTDSLTVKHGRLVPLVALRRELEDVPRPTLDRVLFDLERRRQLYLKIANDPLTVPHPEEGIRIDGRGLVYFAALP